MYCVHCYYCRNLRLTENNIFCYYKRNLDEYTVSQKSYRAFNQEVGLERYRDIKSQVNKVLGDLASETSTCFWATRWEKVTNDQWRQLLIIPEAKDFKKGFEYIAGIKIFNN